MQGDSARKGVQTAHWQSRKTTIEPQRTQPEQGIPECPAELGPVARREWDRLGSELASLGLLTNLDRAALAAYCGAYALWAEATEAIQKYGTMVKSPSGYPIQSRWVGDQAPRGEFFTLDGKSVGGAPPVVQSIERSRNTRCMGLGQCTSVSALGLVAYLLGWVH
jgi:hypothetical protein